MREAILLVPGDGCKRDSQRMMVMEGRTLCCEGGWMLEVCGRRCGMVTRMALVYASEV